MIKRRDWPTRPFPSYLKPVVPVSKVQKPRVGLGGFGVLWQLRLGKNNDLTWFQNAGKPIFEELKIFFSKVACSWIFPTGKRLGWSISWTLFSKGASFRVIRIRIRDPRWVGSWCIKGTEVTDSSVPLMHYDLSDLGSLILIQITPKEGTLKSCSYPLQKPFIKNDFELHENEPVGGTHSHMQFLVLPEDCFRHRDKKKARKWPSGEGWV